MSYQTLDPFRADPANWKLGMFYFCREDRRLVVPRKWRGVGWTLNLARPMAVPGLVGIVALVSVVADLLRDWVS